MIQGQVTKVALQSLDPLIVACGFGVKPYFSEGNRAFACGWRVAERQLKVA